MLNRGRNSTSLHDLDGFSEEELAALWRKSSSTGGGPAAGELLGRFRMRVYHWCRSFVGDHETALDLAQDSLLKAYQDFGSLRKSARFGTWLYVIVRHKCLDELKKRRVRGTNPIDPDTLPAGGADPENAWLEQLAFVRFTEIMDSVLQPAEKEAISLRCFEKMPVETITTVLDIQAPSGARGVLQTARRKLRAAIEADEKDRETTGRGR